MRNDNHNPFHIIENGLDMAINLVVFYISYYLIIFLGMPVVVDIQKPKTMAMLFIAIILLSFVYQFFNLYRPIPYIGTRYSLRPIRTRQRAPWYPRSPWFATALLLKTSR